MVIIHSMLIWSFGKLLKDGDRKYHKMFILSHFTLQIIYIFMHSRPRERKDIKNNEIVFSLNWEDEKLDEAVFENFTFFKRATGHHIWSISKVGLQIISRISRIFNKIKTRYK